MKGFRRENVAGRDLMTNQGITEAYIDDLYNVWRVGPGAWVNLLNGAAISRLSTGSHTALDLPDNGLISAAFAERSAPLFWERGNLQVSIVYTSDVGSTNNFVVGGTLSAVVKGGVLSASGTTITNAVLPGPAVAYTEKTYTFPDLIPITAQHRMIGVKPARSSGNASDTNVNHFYLLELIVEFLPAKGQ